MGCRGVRSGTGAVDRCRLMVSSRWHRLDQRLPLRLAKRSPRRRELERCRCSSRAAATGAMNSTRGLSGSRNSRCLQRSCSCAPCAAAHGRPSLRFRWRGKRRAGPDGQPAGELPSAGDPVNLDLARVAPAGTSRRRRRSCAERGCHRTTRRGPVAVVDGDPAWPVAHRGRRHQPRTPTHAGAPRFDAPASGGPGPWRPRRSPASMPCSGSIPC